MDKDGVGRRWLGGPTASGSGRWPSIDAAVEVDGRAPARAPEPALLRPRPERVAREHPRVPPLPTAVEVRRRVAALHQEHVDVEAVADTDHVAEEATVLIDRVC